jgi:membrane protein DedA with SNARE-associated domain
MLNSSNKYLLATTVLTDWAPFAAVAFLRLMAPDPLFYALGFVYRGRALGWARQVFPGMDQVFDQFESQGGATRNLLDVAVFIAPNNPVCLLAGVAAMPWRRFLALAVTGTLARIALMRIIGTIFSDQIEDLLEIVARYQRWFTLASVAAVGIYLVYQVVGRRGLVGGVESLDDELGDPED